MSNKLYNTQTRQPEALPEDQIPQAILAGTHSYEQSARVNVINPEGQAKSVPATQLKDALTMGYRMEGAMEAGVRKHVEENRGIEGIAKVFATKAADEALFGVPGIIYNKTADPFEVAKYEALKKEHSTAAILGGITGFGASLFYGGPLFKAATTAGKASAKVAEKAVAESLKAAGVKRFADKAAKGVLASAGKKAVEMGVEGAVIAAPRAITEAALGDPEAAGESLLYGIGIGAALGVPTGILGHSFKRIKDRRARLKAEEAKALASRKDPDLSKAETIFDDVTDNIGSIYDDVAESVTKQSGKASQGARRVLEAAERQQIPLFPTVSSDSDFLRAMGSDLANTQVPTHGAKMWKAEIQKTFEGMQNTASRGLGKITPDDALNPMSAAEAGELAKGGMLAKIRSQVDEAGGMYDELRELTTAIPVNPRSVQRVVGNITKADAFKFLGAEGRSKIAEFNRMASAVSTVDDLKRLSTSINNTLGLSSSREARAVVTEIRSRLASLEENTIKRFAEREMKTPQAKERVLSLIETRKQANQKWSQIIEELEETGLKGRVRSPGEFLDFIEKMEPAQLSQKLFNRNKTNALKAFAESFPDEMEALRRYKLQEIASKSVKDGQFQIGSLLRQVKNLPKEQKQILFTPDQLRSLDDLRIIYERLPPNMNPSGSAYTLERLSLFKNPLDYAYQNVVDRAKFEALTRQSRADGVLFLEQSMKRIGHKLDEIPEALDSLSRLGSKRVGSTTTGVATMAGLIALLDSNDSKPKSREEAFNRIEEKLNETITQPKKLEDNFADISATIDEGGAPKAAEQFTLKLQQALRYLHGEMPKALMPPTLVHRRKFRPSDHELNIFERRIQAAMDPLSIIDSLKDGSLTREQVETVEAIYPKLMMEIKTRVIKELAENPKDYPYAARLKLSLLLDQELDPSLSTESIQMLQQGFRNPAQDQSAGTPPFAPSRMDSGLHNRTATDSQLTQGRRMK